MSLATDDFDFIATLVHRRSAIVLERGKEYLVESRLAPVARRRGAHTISELVAELRSRSWGDLHGEVVEAMTTNETHFFRDVQPWETLRTVVIPQLTAARTSTRRLTFWCAAASSGQEPYTVAMVLREHFPELGGWNVRIIATDISTEMVSRTTAGVYSQLEVNRGLPARFLVKYFTKEGAEWRIAPELRAMVEARVMNLAEPWAPGPAADVVFLRNVLIYFDVETRRAIFDQAARRLAPDGVLFLGTAESTLNVTNAFARVPQVNAAMYRLATKETQ